MKKLHLAVTGIITIAVLVTANVLFVPQTRPQPASATFSHEACQYPDRWSNPVDGCDNTDPAVPECIKAMYTQEAEQECIAAFVKAHSPATEPVTTTPATETLTTNTCGGK